MYWVRPLLGSSAPFQSIAPKLCATAGCYSGGVGGDGDDFVDLEAGNRNCLDTGAERNLIRTRDPDLSFDSIRSSINLNSLFLELMLKVQSNNYKLSYQSVKMELAKFLSLLGLLHISACLGGQQV